ncbi:tRNA (adenosine(37)-N6)-threonylcarbamoyltransferase complex dimerization subunit type 1 TsaB [Poriferisphaera corsica]|nr:tRNA (adenosine(37)-N6)-threonylcarbamoyltransferase complex dimerization subunit type 1 TsaB [Poriferisphaera corsica]
MSENPSHNLTNCQSSGCESTPPSVVSLAIEASGRVGRIAIGRGDQILAVRDLPASRRHNLDLMQTVDEIFTEQGIAKSDLKEVYISTGPGSFTGLRIAITTAKMLAMVLGCKIIEVPTLQVVMNQGVSDDLSEGDCIAACLNLKRDTVYSGIWQQNAEGEMIAVSEPKLRSSDELRDEAGDQLRVVVGEVLPEALKNEDSWTRKQNVKIISGPAALADASHTWLIGRSLSKAGKYIEAKDLQAAYIREPEAVTLWNMNHPPAPGSSRTRK